MHRRVPILSYSHPLHFGPTSPPAVRYRFWSIEAHPSSLLFYRPPQPPTSRHQVAALSKPAAATNRNISRSGAPLVTLCPQTSSGSPPPWNHITTSVASLAPVKRRHLFMLPTRALNGTQHPSNPYYPQRSHPDPLRQHQWGPPPPSSTSTTPRSSHRCTSVTHMGQPVRTKAKGMSFLHCAANVWYRYVQHDPCIWHFLLATNPKRKQKESFKGESKSRACNGTWGRRAQCDKVWLGSHLDPA
jgi:hypothetical protein